MLRDALAVPAVARRLRKQGSMHSLPYGRGFHEKAGRVKHKLGRATNGGHPRPTGGVLPSKHFPWEKGFGFWSCHPQWRPPTNGRRTPTQTFPLEERVLFFGRATHTGDPRPTGGV